MEKDFTKDEEVLAMELEPGGRSPLRAGSAGPPGFRLARLIGAWPAWLKSHKQDPGGR